jgi:predicted acetyltransferase
MANGVFISKPSAEYHDEYIAFYEEWKESKETMIPWVIGKDPSDFEGMLQFLRDSENEENIPATWVPSSTYWLIDEEKKVVGAVNIRHQLTEKLLHSGGHIGYGIRPSERRKGYATKLLSLALEKAKELGIQKALVVCDEDNIGSERTILKNGGAFESTYVKDDGNAVKRFWIEMK